MKNIGTAALITALVIGASSMSGAQERVSDQLALARVGASECGLASCTADELAAIAAVLRSRCEECSLASAARMYSSRVFDPQRTDARAWIAHLEPRGGTPARWPDVVRTPSGERAHPSWSAYRERWLSLYELAGRVVRGEIVARCEPDHWGGPMDRDRARRLGLVKIDCGDTRNDFYRVPRRSAS